jgi:signal transduction histidine kinase
VTTRREKEGMAAFEVSDNGCGMDEEVKKKIFTGFFSTKGSKGTGLGLIVTHKILQEHGGNITVQSEPGKGSTFISRLPYKPQEC